MTQTDIQNRPLVKAALAVAAIVAAAVGWFLTGSIMIACGLGAVAWIATILICALSSRCRDQAPGIGDSAQNAARLANAARQQLERLTARAAETRDDEVNFRAHRLSNTVTLLIEALQDTPSRHGELHQPLGCALPEATAVTEKYAAQCASTPNGRARNAFLRYLQETELQFEYTARSFVMGARSKAQPNRP